MSDTIAPATLERLSASNPPKGSRHAEMVKIAVSLVGDGMADAAIFAVLRSKFPDQDKTDSEIWGVINWAKKCNPQPSRSANSGQPRRQWSPPEHRQEPEQPKRTPAEHADWWNHGLAIDQEKMVGMSKVGIPQDSTEAAVLALLSLYDENDHINIITRFIEDGGKAKPCGSGKTLQRDEWAFYLRHNGVPSSNAGAWFRLNPCSPTGSGADGAYTDADIVAWKFVLVESDNIPVEKQLALWANLPLPIAAVVLSGGLSAHAWVRVQCSSLEEYKAMAAQLLDALKPFGVDQANKNASRLCRLPGAIRQIGCVEPTEQRLLWLNPDAQPLTEEALRRFEQTLTFQRVLDKPMLPLARTALERYEFMAQNQGKLGITTGIPALDRVSGGWKKGNTIVIAGQTGGGKTTMALHHIRCALKAGHGVLMFSLEMDRDEIFDLIVSAEMRIKRDKFNTGAFSEYDMALMQKDLSKVAGMRLYIEDSALSGPEQIKARVFQLKASGMIDLVVVDYIQFVNPGLSRDNREQQVAAISHTLRTVAREANVPMIILSQLNDEGRLRESRVIAHNANIVAMVEMQDNDRVKLSVVKGRSIPRGEYYMEFDRQFGVLIPDNDINQQTAED